MNNIKRIFYYAFGLAIASAMVYGFFTYHQLQIWKYEGPNTTFAVRAGESFARINYRLQKNGLISNSTLFYRLAKLKGVVTRVRVGEHSIPTNANMINIITLLTAGPASDISITIPEGKNLYEIGKILEDRGVLSDKNDFIADAKNKILTDSLGIPAETTEGYLYPDTYRFSKNTSPSTIIRKMVKNFFKKVKKLNFKQSKLSPHEVIILASIVEKETGAKFERPLIAGVFHNRLKKKMRLQSDPTTIYGIFEKFDGNLRKKDLLQKTAFNTYKISALPIGPISNPGASSIQSVLMPKEHSFLYFVSQNDGTHVFTKTYKQHLAAVRKWQLNRKNRKGKSWRNLDK
jgi:UPF0755 protein